MNNWGLAFEKYVVKLYEEYKRAVVKHDILEYAQAREGRVRAQFDLLYKKRLIPYVGLGITEHIPTIGPWQYAECKFRKQARVTFDEITTFSGKLQLVGVSLRRGEFITNTSYEKRAEAFAKEVGITLVGREQLVRMDYLRATLKQGFPPLMPYELFDRKLEERIRTHA